MPLPRRHGALASLTAIALCVLVALVACGDSESDAEAPPFMLSLSARAPSEAPTAPALVRPATLEEAAAEFAAAVGARDYASLVRLMAPQAWTQGQALQAGAGEAGEGALEVAVTRLETEPQPVVEYFMGNGEGGGATLRTLWSYEERLQGGRWRVASIELLP